MMESKYWRNADWDEVRNFNVKSNGWVNQIMNITTEGVWYLNYTYLRNKKKSVSKTACSYQITLNSNCYISHFFLI